jgi:hypothetical protein
MTEKPTSLLRRSGSRLRGLRWILQEAFGQSTDAKVRETSFLRISRAHLHYISNERKMSSARKQIPFYTWFLGLLSALCAPEARAARDACNRVGGREERWWRTPSELL